MEQSNNIQPTLKEALESGIDVYMAFPKCSGVTSISIPESVSLAEHSFESVNQQNGPSGGASEDANESGSFNLTG